MPAINRMLDAMHLRAAHGKLHPFTFRTGGGFRGRDVERILLEHGVPVYERVRRGHEELGFSVRAGQAAYAEMLLCRAGVPLTCDLLDPENERLLAAAQDRRSLLERVLDAVARFTA